MRRSILLTTLVLASTTSSAQYWQPIHGPIEYMKGVVVAPNGDVYAGNAVHGAFRSTDNGSTWSAINAGLPDLGVRCMALNSVGEVLASTGSGGVLRYVGGTWTPFNTGLPATPPSMSNLVNSGAGILHACSATGGLYRYNGATWTDISANLAGLGAGPVGVDNAGTAYTCVYGTGVYKYNGATWSLFGSGLPDSNVGILAFSPTNEVFTASANDVYKLASAGGTWTALNTGFGRRITALFTDAQQRLYCATLNFQGSGVGDGFGNLHVSLNSGASFAPVIGDGLSTQLFALASNATGDVFVGASGVFRSAGGTGAWQDMGTTIVAPKPCQSFAYGPAGELYFLSPTNGVFRSGDGGATWQMRMHGITKVIGRSVFVSSTGTVFAGMNSSQAFDGNGSLYRSADGGQNWTQVLAGNDWYLRMEQMPNGDLYSGQAFEHPTNLARSSDDGLTWTTLPLTEGVGYDINMNRSGHLLVGTETGALQRSIDEGQNWTELGPYAAGNIVSVGIDHHDNVLCGNTASGGILYVSDSTHNGDLPVLMNNWTLGNGAPRYFLFDLNDNVFIGSNNGMHTASPPWSTSTAITLHNDGLSSSAFCRGLFAGLDGHLWMGTQGGLVRSSADFSAQLPVKVKLRAYLDGAYTGAVPAMRDDLRAAGLIPLLEPYSALGYAHVHGGGERTTAPVLAVTGANAVTDWVVIELRSAVNPAQVLATRSALLQRDGDVVGMDGVSAPSLNIGSGSYYIALRHRNHLGVMTAAPVALSGNASFIDLSLAATPTWGVAARKVIGSIATCWTGDVIADGVVKYTGSNNDRDAILTAIGGIVPTNTLNNVYLRTDLNLDGKVKYTGTANDRDLILSVIGGIVPTNTRSAQLP